MTPKSMTPKSMTPKSMTPKSMTPKMTPESPRKSRMGPKKSALAQVSASQDEEDSSLNDSDLVPTNKGRSSKRQSSKTKKDRKAKMTPNQTAASAAPPASLPTPPASVAVSNNSWSISSEDDLPKEDSDDETKDQSYGVGAKYKSHLPKVGGRKLLHRNEIMRHLQIIVRVAKRPHNNLRPKIRPQNVRPFPAFFPSKSQRQTAETGTVLPQLPFPEIPETEVQAAERQFRSKS